MSRPRRLFWRIYRYNLVLLVVVVVGAGVAGWLLGGHYPPRRNARLMATRVAGELSASDDPELLRRRVRDLHLLARVDVAAYDGAGHLLAAAGEHPPGPVTTAERLHVASDRLFHRGSRVLAAVPLRGGGHLVVSWSGTEALLRLGVSLLLILALVALVALPLARAITRPLQRVADTARALGEGDLSARTGLQRRDELGQLARVLDQMAARLERVVQGEKELWANISHEIRTPLARIRVALELAEEEGDADALRQHLAGISGDLTELDRLLDDVLMSARLDLTAGPGGALVLRRERLEVTRLVDQAAQRFAHRHPARQLEQQLAPGLPALEADPALLGRVLANLLDNAAKYSEPDTAVELAASADDSQVVLEVRDRGIGVAEEDLPRLFEHFFRSDRSRARKSGGSGLGLTLCQRIVEAHGGEIAATLRDGGGLVIRCALPLHIS